jgi:hypothetical protein
MAAHLIFAIRDDRNETRVRPWMAARLIFAIRDDRNETQVRSWLAVV